MPMQTGIVYHQKVVLVENISRYVRDIEADSLLDIGAGSLETALPLSSKVLRYDAIEQDPINAARLKNAGLNVIQGTFPFSVNGTYDLVLSSHSVPENSIESYLPFLSSAWDLTSPKGMMLVVTFKGSVGDFATIRHELLGRSPQRCEELETIVDFYENSGGVMEIERINSFVEAARSEDIVSFLAPWLSADQNMRESIHLPFVRIIETRYKIRQDLFAFPTQHLFLSCRKE